MRRSRPVESCRVRSNSGQGYIGGLGNVHSKDADEIGCRFPKSLPGAMKQPSRCQQNVARKVARVEKSGSEQQDKAGKGERRVGETDQMTAARVTSILACRTSNSSRLQ